MEIVAIIPARGGSKGVPGKNLKELAGKPLIAYTIEAAKHSKYVTRVIVSTEDEEIAQVSKSFDAEIVKRPDILASDEAKTAPVIVHVLEELEKQNYKPDIIVLLQPTSPLRTEHTIDGALEQLIKSNYDSILSAKLIGNTLGLWVKHCDGSFHCDYNYHLRPRRQDESLIEQTYCETGSFYAIKYDAFKKTNDFLGENPDLYIMTYEPTVDINTEEDFINVENILKTAAYLKKLV